MENISGLDTLQENGVFKPEDLEKNCITFSEIHSYWQDVRNILLLMLLGIYPHTHVETTWTGRQNPHLRALDARVMKFE
jgi:hypothetical protein